MKDSYNSLYNIVGSLYMNTFMGSYIENILNITGSYIYAVKLCTPLNANIKQKNRSTLALDMSKMTMDLPAM